jgi:hypothetical protein
MVLETSLSISVVETSTTCSSIGTGVGSCISVEVGSFISAGIGSCSSVGVCS